jgi:hypothetical protein
VLWGLKGCPKELTLFGKRCPIKFLRMVLKILGKRCKKSSIKIEKCLKMLKKAQKKFERCLKELKRVQ